MDPYEELDELYNNHFGITDPQSILPISETEENSNQDENVQAEKIINRRINDLINISNDESSDDENDTSNVNQDMSSELLTCHCLKNCLRNFTDQELTENIFSIREMSKEAKEMLIMGTLRQTGAVHSTLKNTERKRSRYSYVFKGENICREAFMKIFDTTDKVLKNIITHMRKHGATPRSHGNKGKRPTHSLKFEEVENAVMFLRNYADEFGIPQTAAPSNSDNIPPIFLPASDTKKDIHKRYKHSCSEKEVRALGISAFEDLWLKCVPHIKISKPRDDVCQICEKSRKNITDACTEDEKLAVLHTFEAHILAAKKERMHYRECVAAAVEEMQNAEDGLVKNVHYTFDFAQHFLLPHHARQMGPTYFCQLRKVQIFGVRNDSISTQLNYLIDEDQTIGIDGSSTNGPNAVISMLDHTLQEQGFGEESCTLHADNCSGQNKNQFVIGYLCWRVLLGLNHEIQYKMQIPGHTRCLVDTGFGHIRKLYRRTDVDSFQQLINVVEKSSTSNLAIPYIINSKQNWQWRDWKSFLSSLFKPIKHIRKYQHFRFNADYHGSVFVKSSVDAAEEEHKIMKIPIERLDIGARPSIIVPPGLSIDRQRYLHQNVRPYVRPCYQDITCPPPASHEE